MIEFITGGAIGVIAGMIGAFLREPNIYILAPVIVEEDLE